MVPMLDRLQKSLPKIITLTPINWTPAQESERRLYGGEVSAPSNPTSQKLKETWKEMVELSLGVPCAPFELTQFTGDVKKKQTGRKFPLKEIRDFPNKRASANR